MSKFNQILDFTINDPVALVFAAVIVFILLLAAFFHLRSSEKHALFVRAAPTFLTSIGVLGTFTGIVLGLVEFNVSDIDGSVPPLLEALKIAFVTSIFGMGAAILFRGFQIILPRNADDTVIDATPEAILQALHSLETTTKAGVEGQLEAMESVRNAISADGDGSLLTQMQKMRSSIQDGQQELTQEFRQFAEKMAENNSKALIEALEQVIKDFNENLTAQFGENFKQLNEAVAALLTWQENYKNHVESLEEKIETTVLALSHSEQSLTKITSETEKIPPALEAMNTITVSIHTAINDLETRLKAFESMRDNAIKAFPEIEANLKALTDDFGEAVRKNTDANSKIISQQRETYDQLQEGYGELRKSASEAQNAFITEMSKSLQEVENQINKALSQHSNAIDSTSEEMKKQISEAWGKTQDALNEQFQNFDRQMQSELNRAIEKLGSNMAALSGKFVDDYTPLTNRLREVIQIAERA